MPDSSRAALAKELRREQRARLQADPTRLLLSPKQSAFALAPQPNRALCGANGSGKTMLGIREGRLFSEGRHPVHKDLPVPNSGMIACETFDLIEDMILPYLGIRPRPHITAMFPSGMLEWKSLLRQAHHPNGSIIQIKSYDQGRARFQSSKFLWVHLDEEPEEDIWDETGARLVGGQTLHRWLTYTALKGMTWSYDEFVAARNPETHWYGEIELRDNPSIRPEDFAEAEKRYGRSKVKKSRLFGGYTQVSEQPCFEFAPLEQWLELAAKETQLVGEMDSDDKFYEAENGRLVIWEKPEPRFKYVMGADVAEGIEGRAYSVNTVLRLPDGAQVAQFRAHIAPVPFGHVIARMGRYYNRAFSVPEVNNHGHATVEVLVNQEEYLNVYQRAAADSFMGNMSTGEGRWGFSTQTASRVILESNLQHAISTGSFYPRCPVFLKEAIASSYDDKGVMRAGRGQHLDTVIAMGLAIEGMKQKKGVGWPGALPERDTIEWARWHVGTGRGASRTRLHREEEKRLWGRV